MTDEHDETALSPEEETEVRRLLADAGGPVPTPPDVTARLDETLAALVAERQGAGDAAADDAAVGAAPDAAPGAAADSATVVPLAGRRRHWPKVLLAAAAVIVGGYAVNGALTGTMSGSEDSDAGADAGGGIAADAPESADGLTSDDGLESAPTDASGADRDGRLLVTDQGAARVSSDDLTSGVRRLLGPGAASELADSAKGNANRSGRGGCTVPPSTTKDRWFVVRYDGEPATLVVGPIREGTARTSVYSCDGTQLLQRAQVVLR